jgi:hypothetical protein
MPEKKGQAGKEESPTKPVSLVYQGNGSWTGTINVGYSAPAGTMLIVRAISAQGVTYERVVNKVEQAGIISMPAGHGLRPLSAVVTVRSDKGLQFTVNLPRPGAYSLDLYTVAGVKLWSHRGESASGGMERINRGAGSRPIVNGTYVLILQSGSQRIVRKFAVYK